MAPDSALVPALRGEPLNSMKNIRDLLAITFQAMLTNRGPGIGGRWIFHPNAEVFFSAFDARK